MKSKFKKAKLRFSKDFLQSNKQKSLFKKCSQQHWNLWLKNRQLNTFANQHHSMDENSTKINVLEITLNNQKQQWKLWQWKPKDPKRQIPRKCQSTTFMKQRSGWSQSGFVKQTKSHPKARLTQRLNSIFLSWWNRAAKIPSKKSCVF